MAKIKTYKALAEHSGLSVNQFRAMAAVVGADSAATLAGMADDLIHGFNTYGVVYGMSGREGLSRKAAVREYRECVDHQLECASILTD